jgi:hypothetical protein
MEGCTFTLTNIGFVIRTGREWKSEYRRVR